MNARFRTRSASSLLLCLATGCTDAFTARPAGLVESTATEGPKVVFDLDARPLPEIPFPNDLATRPDPESPTGRRLNLSLLGPTLLESEVRAKADALDGFGTFAPITVSFDAAIDAPALRALHLDRDPTNDGVYLVDVDPQSPDFGTLVPVDLGYYAELPDALRPNDTYASPKTGRFASALDEPNNYFPFDPRAGTSTLLFEPSGWRLTDRVAGPMAGASPGSGRAQILPDGATVLGAESGTPTSETWEGLLGGGSGVFVAQTRGPVLAGSVPGPSGWFAVRVADRPSAPEVEGAWRAAGFRVGASGRVVPSPVEWAIEAGAFQWRPLDGEGTRVGSLQSVDANAEGASGAGHRLVLGDIGELDVLNAVFSPNRRVAVVWRSVGGQPVDGAWLAVRAAPTN